MITPLLALTLLAPQFDTTDLFRAGEGGYALYRIPGLVATAKGTLLAYCEARKTARGDWGPIDIVLRRSTDGGKTWGQPQKIGKRPPNFVKNPVALKQKLAGPDDLTFNNPVAVADRAGAVHFLYCVDYARCFYSRSDDDGATFGEPVEITAAFERFRPEYDWKVLATGPGHGIQLRTGRLLVPVWLSTGTGGHAHRPSVVSTVVSDDGGRTWRRGAIAARNEGAVVNPNETSAAELSDGRVLLNVRNESARNRRLTITGRDGEAGWGEPTFHDDLWEPVCMASLLRLDGRRLLFANPHNLQVGGKDGRPGQSRERRNLTVKLSEDDGRTWPAARVIEPGWAGYSDLAATGDGVMFCLFERGTPGGRRFEAAALTLARFNLAWLTERK